MAKIFQSTAKDEQDYFNDFRNNEFYKKKEGESVWKFNFYNFFTSQNIESSEFLLEYWTKPGDYNGDGTLWKYLEYGPNGNILGGSIKQGKPYEKYGLWSPKKDSIEGLQSKKDKDGNCEFSFKDNSYAWKTSVWENENNAEEINAECILKTLVQEFKQIVDWARLGFDDEQNDEQKRSGYQLISEYVCDKTNRKFSSNVVWKIAYMFSSNGKSGDDAAPGILPIYGTAAWEFFNKAYGLNVENVDANRHIAQERLMNKLDEIKGVEWRNGINFFETYIELWTQYENLKDYYYLLVANKNLILTGAPGTGKTYMAKQLAKLLGANPETEQFKFVQFHPSYDYTDFVEGLRPTSGSKSGSVVNFVRRDGVFKEFCKKALEALEKNEDYKNAKNLFDNERTVENANKLSDAIAKAPKYVFVIDEINRGEMSKIFGELFFSIDPGYRGEKGLVQTQYQNLIDMKTDVFKDGFYVPENVYIIGTMNDIDRSVDSMDFAMRRRFAWMEVTAEESAKNMGLDPESVQRMTSLNEAIENVDGLNPSYHIGASYFLKLDKCGNGKDRYNNLWDFYISGVVKEYLRGMSDAEEQLEKIKKAYNFLIPMALLERIDNLNSALKDNGADLKIKISDFKEIFTDSNKKSMSMKPEYADDAKIESNMDGLWKMIEAKISKKVSDVSLNEYKNVFLNNEFSPIEEEDEE